ncbi:hypothetical protein CRYUN_Cryun11dG0026100 [Craigia yunnanensis]
MELIESPIREISNPCEVLRSIHVGPLPQPKQPGFFTERDLVEAGSSPGHRKLLSSNGFTITEVEAR